MDEDSRSGLGSAPERRGFALQEYLPSAIAICIGTAISVVGFVTTHLYHPFGGGYVASWTIVAFVVLFAGWMAQILVSSQLRARLVEQSVGERTWRLAQANAALEAEIAERKRAEEKRAELERELRQAHKMESLGTLAGGIAHEINTPIQYVGDNIRFLRGAVADLIAALHACETVIQAVECGGDSREAARRARTTTEAADLAYVTAEMPKSIEESLEGIERISEIVRAIKEFSHPVAKEKSPTDINHIISTTITVARNQWKYVADVETDFDPGLPLVPCLVGELNQVILNLIVNAAHAIEEAGRGEKGRIVISTRSAEGWAEIRVRDTGCGITREHRDKIFDPFFTTKEPRKGSGQGLAISHTIVTKKHGGTIAFEPGAGAGTTFVIRLPLAPADRSQVAA